MPLYEVIIPYRDRGIDPLRGANLAYVVDWWENWGFNPIVASDGRLGKQQFNRSAAYNRGMTAVVPDADGYIFAESDMVPDTDDQIDAAVELAEEHTGLVVPFDQYRYLSADASEAVRRGMHPDEFKPEWTMDNGRSIGAINVVSRKTMEMVGQFDEKFEGNWYDDDAMKIAFEVCTGQRTRWGVGPAYHLYHLPGHRGSHLTPEDKAATELNRRRLRLYQQAATWKNVARIRQLLKGQ